MHTQYKMIETVYKIRRKSDKKFYTPNGYGSHNWIDSGGWRYPVLKRVENRKKNLIDFHLEEKDDLEVVEFTLVEYEVLKEKTKNGTLKIKIIK